MTSRHEQPRDVAMLVTIYMNGMPSAMCMAERISLSGMVIRLTPWALYPETISEVAFTWATQRGAKRYRASVVVEEVKANQARLLFHYMDAETRAALRNLLAAEGPTDQGGLDDPTSLSGVS